MSRELGEMLVKAGKISQEQLAQAVNLQKETKEKLGEVLIRMGAVSDEEELSTFVGRQLNIGGLRLADIELNRKMLSEIAIADPAAFDAIVEKARAAAEAVV